MNTPKVHVKRALMSISHRVNVSDSIEDKLVAMCELARSDFSHLLPHGDMRRLESRSLLGSLLLSTVLVDEYPTCKTIADFGGGIGFPGLPMAIISPGLYVKIVESNKVKIQAAESIATALNINNVDFECRDIREEQTENEYDVIVGRRVAPIESFLSMCNRHRPSLGCLYLCGYNSTQMQSSLTQVIKLESLSIDGVLPIKGECIAVVHSNDLKSFNNLNRWSKDRYN